MWRGFEKTNKDRGGSEMRYQEREYQEPTLGSIARQIIGGAILGALSALIQPPRRHSHFSKYWWIRWNLYHIWELELGIK